MTSKWLSRENFKTYFDSLRSPMEIWRRSEHFQFFKYFEHKLKELDQFSLYFALSPLFALHLIFLHSLFFSKFLFPVFFSSFFLPFYAALNSPIFPWHDYSPVSIKFLPKMAPRAHCTLLIL
jgi:hypothetical protein